jgi:hypothetical protein
LWRECESVHLASQGAHKGEKKSHVWQFMRRIISQIDAWCFFSWDDDARLCMIAMASEAPALAADLTTGSRLRRHIQLAASQMSGSPSAQTWLHFHKEDDMLK